MKPRWSVFVSLFIIAGLWLAPASTIGAVALSPQTSDAVRTSTVSESSHALSAAPFVPNAPQDVPDTLVPSGVSDYTIASPKLFWHTAPAPCPPHGPAAPTDDFVDLVSRVAIQGSLPRQLYNQQLVCDGLVGRITSSNLVADDNY
ncbi:MAG TPA: hypothetical protein VLG46_09685, partial [Anaerolineae bacterium]|nr:hypothetical protein [Anaerolineae bacterium]